MRYLKAMAGARKKPGPPPRIEEPMATHIRMPRALIEALDAWVEDLRASGAPGVSGITRTDLIRDLLAKAVAERPKGTER